MPLAAKDEQRKKQRDRKKVSFHDGSQKQDCDRRKKRKAQK